MKELRSRWGETVTWDALQRIIISHSHVDHFGGLAAVCERTEAPVAVHPWDRAIVEDPQAALPEEAQQMDRLLTVSGVPTALRGELVHVPQTSSPELRPVAVQDTVVEGDVIDGVFRVIHTPGHRSGQICVQVDDVALCADHVLSNIRPRLVPDLFEKGSGLRAYLAALDRTEAMPGVRLALGGHGDPMVGSEFHARIQALRTSHHRRLQQVWEACAEPSSLFGIAERLYGPANPLMLIFQLQAVATWTEYLCENGDMTRLVGDDGALLFVRTADKRLRDEEAGTRPSP